MESLLLAERQEGEPQVPSQLEELAENHLPVSRQA